MASNAENVSIWWRHHELGLCQWISAGTVMTNLGFVPCTGIYRPSLNILRQRQNCSYFAVILNCIFLNKNAWISLKISLKFVPKVRIDKRTCWTTGSWRSCLNLEVVSSIPAGSTMIYRFLYGFICVSLCQSITIKPTNMYVCMYVCIIFMCVCVARPQCVEGLKQLHTSRCASIALVYW